MSETLAIPLQRRYDCAACKVRWDCRGAWPPGAGTAYKACFCVVQSEEEFNSDREEEPRKRTDGGKYHSATTGKAWTPPMWLDSD